MKLKIYYALFVLLLLTMNVFAQKPAILTSEKPGWNRIGELDMNLKNDTSALEVIGADGFAAIRIKVLKGSAGLALMVVDFEEGESQVVSFYRTLNEGEQTAAISLKGGERSLRKISIVGKTMPEIVEEKARIRITGFKTPKGKK